MQEWHASYNEELKTSGFKGEVKIIGHFVIKLKKRKNVYP